MRDVVEASNWALTPPTTAAGHSPAWMAYEKGCVVGSGVGGGGWSI